jgi:hypothetical protein
VGHHDYDFFLSPERYFDEYPEFFSLIREQSLDWKRGSKKRIRTGQICMSNPQAVATFAENVIHFVRTHPEVDMVSLMPNDVGGFCECDGCTPRPGIVNLSDIILRFTNTVAKAVSEVDPDIKIGFLAYSAYIEPPLNTRPFKNVFLCYAWHSRDYTRSFQDQSAGEMLKRWLPLFSREGGGVFIYEYYADEWQYRCLTLPIAAAICGDVRFFTELSSRERVGEYASEISGVDIVVFPLEHTILYDASMYAFAQMSWNPKLSPEAVVRRFCSSLYRDAESTMADFYLKSEKAMVAAQHYIYAVPDQIRRLKSPSWYDEQIATGEKLLEQFGRWRKTLSQAANRESDEKSRQRIVKTELTFEYGEYYLRSVLHQAEAFRRLVGGEKKELASASQDLAAAAKALQDCRAFAREKADELEGLFWLDRLEVWIGIEETRCLNEIGWVEKIMREKQRAIIP